jgi:hypothetical protein
MCNDHPVLIYIISEITLIQLFQTRFTVSSVHSNFMTGSIMMNVCPHRLNNAQQCRMSIIYAPLLRTVILGKDRTPLSLRV